MYIKYFGLSQSPFRTAPDPEYFFASVQHLRAVDRVVHAIRERAGLILILGEIGQGKTTVCRYIQKRYADEFLIGYLGNPFLNAQEFGEQILQEFGVSGEQRTSRDIVRSLTDFLLEQERKGRLPVLFLDEAHLLSPDVLEFLLIITNIQHGGKHLLQMVLAGQNEFQETLRHPRFSSLNQRLGTRIQVTGLTAKDVEAYIRFRLAQAGAGGKTLFSHSAITRIWKVARGNPRVINQACERLLERAYEHRSLQIRRKDVDRLIKDPIFEPLLFPQGKTRIPWGGVLCAGFVLLAILGISRPLHTVPDVLPPAVTGIVSSHPDMALAPEADRTPEAFSVSVGGSSAGSSPVARMAPVFERLGDNGTGVSNKAVLDSSAMDNGTILTNDRIDVHEKLEHILKLLEQRERVRLGDAQDSSAVQDAPPAFVKNDSVEKKKRFPVTARPQPEKKREVVNRPLPQTSIAGSDRVDDPKVAVDPTSSPMITDHVFSGASGVHVDAIVWDTDPGFRLAVVNERIVKEGDVLGEGYRLEKIYHSKIRFSKDGQIYEGSVDQRKGTGVQ